ncbi:hypothetical protein Y032_0988g3299 [Ancylostoma ceylanicum]|uniref:Tc1-like transposase DDE domain-containing protein n=1 Tax=Ancylostoma ceylanicum TaxID=53326 RepID=A0A016W7D6_9BILA|nr:hypothetical protein Y032_0988g3299 [Ancylostoma ceylanicum]
MDVRLHDEEKRLERQHHPAVRTCFHPGGVLVWKNHREEQGRGRAIMVSAITEEGIVPGCTRVLVSSRSTVDQHYHCDMNHVMFEGWLRESLPHLIEVGAGCRLSLVMDNAPHRDEQCALSFPATGGGDISIVTSKQSYSVTQ